MDHASALELSFMMGEALLRNGAEISRVQETMERVARSYHVQEFDVYVLTNAIFANGVEDGVRHTTQLKHIPSTTIHFGRISAVNQLSREIAEGKHTVSEAFALLEEAKSLSPSKLPLTLLACALGSACFCFLFGGGLLDSASAFLCGFVLEAFLFFCERHSLSKFLRNLLASALAASLAAFFLFLGLGSNLDKIIIGSIIRLVPGVSLTTSIRDFFNGDYLSGTIRMIDAVLVGGCIAVGAGVVIKLISFFPGHFV